MDFESRYKKLNEDQKKAVDTIDGPIMVIAGPGTGKTELLSMRAANILRSTDVLPENILCLTFTESGAAAMRKRLAEIIGRNAYKIGVYTFHSFCSDIIGQHRADFYRGAEFRAADELSTYQILRSIFDELDYLNPLGVMMNDEYSYLRDTVRTISELKKSGLTSAELLAILDSNDEAIAYAESQLASIFADRMSKKTVEIIAPKIEPIRVLQTENPMPGTPPLGRVLADSLQQAVIEASDDNSTKPLTAWRNKWFEKDEEGSFVLIARKRQSKLRAVAVIYDQYLSKMEAASLYDFDDMILQVVHALEHIPDLRFNLQERYQYIMVDEFQDTNLAQLRILTSLTENPVNESKPNILVVGDDDQAIFSFQGADIGNIVGFQELYPKTELVRLKENYRSTQRILDTSRAVIVQGSDRLEKRIPDLDKSLHANKMEKGSHYELIQARTAGDERGWLTQSIKEQIKAGVPPGQIAVLARHHRDILRLLPSLHQAGIQINYERRKNVLEQEIIIHVQLVAEILIELFEGHYDHANTAMPELLAHPAWGVPAVKVWELGLEAHKQHLSWLEVMDKSDGALKDIHTWLITTAQKVNQLALEQMLDLIIGKASEDAYVSPLYDYYFSKQKLDEQPDEYLTYLESLRTIRAKLLDYQGVEVAYLPDFIEFIRLHRRLGTSIVTQRPALDLPDDAINLMTAHKAKGLEFDTVYIVGAVDSTWGERVRSPSSLIGYPANLPLAPAGNNYDERLRLFFVAMTRAKRQLFVSYSLQDDSDKQMEQASFLSGTSATEWSPKHTIDTAVNAAQLDWYRPLVTLADSDIKRLLAPTLEHYKLSATHINNFLDVTRDGPNGFLMNNLLHFPSASSAQAAYGRAIHAVLQRTHNHLTATGHQRPLEDILHDFERALSAQRLNDADLAMYQQKGNNSLQTFLSQHQSSFAATQQAEADFSNQGIVIDDAKLTGMIDLLDIDRANKALIVTDYKTGTAARSWAGKADYEKIKLHKYRHQLMFYKLLIESSREFAGYSVNRGIIQFVEPTRGGHVLALDLLFDDDEVAEFRKLVCFIWRHITTLDLPDTSKYSPDYKGMLAFEQDLLTSS
ncbi:MAG: uvrD [Candidatus Saccharibacteria bacterium]|nr:uvrD [Candidatus Saccharibacteria bacterium]